MSTDRNKTFGKKEHLCKLTLIEQLFGGGAKSNDGMAYENGVSSC